MIEYLDAKGEVIGRNTFVTRCNSENEEIEQIHYIGRYHLELSVADAKTTEYLADAEIILRDAKDKSELARYMTDSTGVIKSDLFDDAKFGQKFNFEVHIEKEDYLTQTFVVDTTMGVNGNIRLDYLIDKLEIGSDVGEIIAINPIYFDLDKYDIRPDAAAELDKIVQVMNENPKIVIELGSHTDCRGSKSYNRRLSDRRAKASAKYVQDRIDNAKRIYGKGYGESQLVNDCGCEGPVKSDCSDEEHQANRRTEFKIVKK